MDEPRNRPWNPDRRWADPLITLLLLFALLGAWGATAAHRGPRPEPQRPGLQTRGQELGQAALSLLPMPRSPGPIQEPPGASFWDRALLSILAAERGDRGQGRRLALEAPLGSKGMDDSFRRSWRAAYEGGAAPTPGELEALGEPLGKGFAYWSLRARLAGRASLDPAPFHAQARSWALPRLAILGMGSLTAFILGLSGLVISGILFFSRKGPRPAAPPAPFAMPWRALLLALLGWFLALRCSGTVAALCLALLPLPKPMALPIAYGFHVCVGVTLLLKAEGITLREAWKRATPGPLPRALGWAIAFLGIAIAGVVLASLLTGPLMRGIEPPQRELLDLVTGLRNPVLMVLLLVTIAGLAPLFEEWVFRGVLLPWLGPRLAARFGAGYGWALAMLVSGLAFGAMHLQPAGLPTLATLGLVLGWAFFRTGSLWTTVAIHACWNASVFLLMRVLA